MACAMVTYVSYIIIESIMFIRYFSLVLFGYVDWFFFASAIAFEPIQYTILMPWYFYVKILWLLYMF